MQIKESDEPQLVKLWNNCLTDRAIAEQLGYKSKDISNYRRDHHMPSNKGLLNWEYAGTNYSKPKAKA
jgi:hypothetical protein